MSSSPFHSSHGPVSLPPHSAAAQEAIATALRQVQEAHDLGRLLTPSEAMALAGREARRSDTLFSIARNVGWQRNVDVDEILAVLVEKFPWYR